MVSSAGEKFQPQQVPHKYTEVLMHLVGPKLQLIATVRDLATSHVIPGVCGVPGWKVQRNSVVIIEVWKTAVMVGRQRTF